MCNRIFKLIDASSIDNNAVVRRLVKQAGMDRLYPHFAFAPDGDEIASPRYRNQSKTGRRNQSMVAATTTAAKNSPVLGKRDRVDQNEGFISKKKGLLPILEPNFRFNCFEKIYKQEFS